VLAGHFFLERFSGAAAGAAANEFARNLNELAACGGGTVDALEEKVKGGVDEFIDGLADDGDGHAEQGGVREVVEADERDPLGWVDVQLVEDADDIKGREVAESEQSLGTFSACEDASQEMTKLVVVCADDGFRLE
jgi:hypothetical protein